MFIFDYILSSRHKMNDIVQVKDVFLKIKKDVILDKINVNFEKGKIHGLIGRNGSGKTMLMKCICGFVKVTSGQVIVDNKIIGKDCDFPNNIGVIIETPGFIPYYSGFRNLKLLAKINNKITDDDIKRAMESVGLNPILKRAVGKYSLGMRQRLGLAQAIMENPEILILDEPMNGLDKEGVQDMRKYLIELRKQGKTIILASHSSEDISVLCDTVNEMDKGKIKKIS